LTKQETRRIFFVDTKRENKMLTKVQKWGNSLALRIPRSFALDAHIESGSLVEISLVDGQIVVKRVLTPKWTLEELLAGVTKENLHHEVDPGEPVGNEGW
jgi:antitoxin MazE